MRRDAQDPTARPIRQRGELPFALIMLAFALAMIAQQPEQAKWIARGVKPHAQPALWPLIGLGGMAFFSALHVVQCLRARKPDTEWREMLVWLRAFEFVLWYLAYAALVPWLGYLLASVVIMMALVWRVGLRTRGYMLAALGFAVGMVLVFKTGLSVKIPGGALYGLFPDPLRIFLSLNF
jgi:lipid-A-disaccharide synthase-like uncharacterized protein